MFQEPETGGDGIGRRPPWRVFYADKKITITSWYVEVDGTRIAVAELREPVVCRTYQYPIIKVAAVTSGIEVVFALSIAAAYGWAWTILGGVVSAATVTAGALADYRKNPRFMSIEVTVRGRHVILFRTPDKQRCGKVGRALIRAVEDNRRPRA